MGVEPRAAVEETLETLHDDYAYEFQIGWNLWELEIRENLDPRSLQSQGDSALALANELAHADYRALKGEDAVYLDVLQRWLPRLAQHQALPAAIIVFLMIALAGYLASRERSAQLLLAGLMPPLLLAGAVGIGFVLHGLAEFSQLNKGFLDNGFAFSDMFNSLFNLEPDDDDDLDMDDDRY